MRRWTFRIFVALIALFALVYIGDWLALQFASTADRPTARSWWTTRMSLKEKGGKVEYFYNPPQPTPCVRALFPHEGPARLLVARPSLGSAKLHELISFRPTARHYVLLLSKSVII